MGARMLRHWLGQPLLELAELNRRLEAVDFFYNNLALRERARIALSHIVDLERVLTRVRLGTVHSRELLALKVSLEASAELVNLLAETDTSSPEAIFTNVAPVITSLISFCRHSWFHLYTRREPSIMKIFIF